MMSSPSHRHSSDIHQTPLPLPTTIITILFDQVNERYPKELERRQKRVQALQEALSNGVNTEIDLQRLQQQANNLHGQIQEIVDRRAQADRAKQGDKSFLQLRQAQQMTQMVSRKKDELNSKLERLQVGVGCLS